MRRLGPTLIALALLLWGCSSSTSGGPNALTRTVLVDYNHDQFAGSFLTYFPQKIEVRPGDTIDFKQAWTGEGHSVTLGTMVNDAVGPVRDILDSGQPLPDQPPPELLEKLKTLPEMLTDNFDVRQSAAQPCYLDSGAPPLDLATACPKNPQPEFNGRQTYYSSGLIPYEGTRGNTYRVKLSGDIAPGRYTFYCSLHGPLQSGEIVVRAKGAKVPSQSAVDRTARKEVEALAKPLLKAYDDAKKGRATLDGKPIAGNLSGYFVPQVQGAFLSEFVPRTIRAKVNEKVTWTFVGGHTISFSPPPYFPEFITADDGTVTFNPDAYRPVAGPGGTMSDDPNVPPPRVDAGKWDGSYFISSGILGNGATYSLTFTKPGRYRYACLIHPRMVGEVVVS